MSANGCSTSTGNIANNVFGNKNISGSIILKSKNNSQKRSANTIIKAHDNVAENEGYKMILPSTKGTAEQVLKIDSVTNNLLNLSWGEGGGGGGGGGSTTLAGLTDVSNTTPSDGQALAYNSSASQWQPRSILSSTSIVGLNLLAQANYWVVAGDSSERSHNYTLQQSGSITVSQDSDNYKYFVTDSSTKFYFIDASSNNAAIPQTTQTSSYAFVVDFDNNGSGSGDVNVLQQRNTEQYSDGNYSHQIIFFDRNGTGVKINGNLLYNNHLPGSGAYGGVFSLGTQSTGSRKMYVITVEPNPSNTSQEKTSLYEIQSNGNVQLLGTDTDEDTYTGTPNTENYIILGSGDTNSATRWYGLAAWPRTLSSFEISLLSESLLLQPKSNYASNLSISSTTPSDGQALVYDATSEEWQPGTVGSTLTVQDEGSSLATAATTLNFTGENVTASGTGATKTINITSDTYSQYSLETSQFSLLSGLTFHSGDFSKFFSNSNGNGEFVRFSLSSYPQSFTWTPHSNEVYYPLTKVVMWTRNSSPTNDIEMFPRQFKIYGRPNAGSSTGETEIGNIILSSQPSRSDNLLISSAAVNSVINTNKVVYNQYRIEIYENNSSSFSNRPLIGELRFYRPSSVQQYGNELTNWTENEAGHIIPSENSSYDIGSAEKKVRHLYLSSNSLNIGDVVLSSEGNDIKIGDNKLVKVTSSPNTGQVLVYNSSNQWVPGLPAMPFFELFGLADSKTFNSEDYLTIVDSSGSTDVNMSGTSFGINKYGTDVPTTSDSVELLQDAVYKIDYSISLNYHSDVRFVYLQFKGASSADGTYSTVRTSVVNTYDDITNSLDYSILSGSVLYSTTSTNRFVKFYLKRNSTVKIHSNSDTDTDISSVYNSIIFQRIK